MTFAYNGKGFFTKDKVITCPYGEIVGFMEVGLISTNCASRKSKKSNEDKEKFNFGQVREECDLV